MKNKQAFTLVELIVVVTILAILSTIGFVSYSGYLAGVRDTNRIAQLKAIGDALHLYSTNKSLPTPDDKIDITTNGTNVISYQGYVGKDVIETVGYTAAGLDPKDNTYYSYYLTKDKKYFQLMAFLEEEQGLTSKIKLNNQIQAEIDYETRYPRVEGSKLGILTGTGGVPIQELESIVDLSDSIGMTSYLSNSDTLTGVTLSNISPVGSCKRLYEVGGKRINGVYTIDPEGDGTGFKVYCDMETDGGGWTLVLGAGNNKTIDIGTYGSYNLNNLSKFSLPGKLSDLSINNIYTSQFRVTTADTTYLDKKLYARLVDGQEWIYENTFAYTEHIKTSITYDKNSLNYIEPQGIYTSLTSNFCFNHWGQIDVWFEYNDYTRFFIDTSTLKPDIFLWVK